MTEEGSLCDLIFASLSSSFHTIKELGIVRARGKNLGLCICSTQFWLVWKDLKLFFPEGLTGFSMNLGDWILMLFEGNISSKFSFVGPVCWTNLGSKFNPSRLWSILIQRLLCHLGLNQHVFIYYIRSFSSRNIWTTNSGTLFLILLVRKWFSIFQ